MAKCDERRYARHLSSPSNGFVPFDGIRHTTVHTGNLPSLHPNPRSHLSSHFVNLFLRSYNWHDPPPLYNVCACPQRRGRCVHAFTGMRGVAKTTTMPNRLLAILSGELPILLTLEWNDLSVLLTSRPVDCDSRTTNPRRIHPIQRKYKDFTAKRAVATRPPRPRFAPTRRL